MNAWDPKTQPTSVRLYYRKPNERTHAFPRRPYMLVINGGKRAGETFYLTKAARMALFKDTIHACEELISTEVPK